MNAKPRHPNLNIPTRVALSLMALRLALFILGADFAGQEETYVFLLFAALPVLAIYGIWPLPGSRLPSTIQDIQSAMRMTLVYSVLMIVFLFLYYTFVDKDFFPNFQDRAIALELENNTELSPEEIERRGREFFSKRNLTVIMIGVMVVMSAFYSILFSVLKKLFFRPVVKSPTRAEHRDGEE